MTTTETRPLHPADRFDDYAVGDDVYCLGWIGMPFKVVGKDEAKRIIQIDGQTPYSVPGGARIDLVPAHHYLLTHEQWDSIWYWPDIAGEHYNEVVGRFVEKHSEGQIVVGYIAGGLTVVDNPAAGVSYRLSFESFHTFGQIQAQPVVAIGDDGASLVRLYDPAIPDERWLASGPRHTLVLRMVGYRWALCVGQVVLNWQDFD